MNLKNRHRIADFATMNTRNNRPVDKKTLPSGKFMVKVKSGAGDKKECYFHLTNENDDDWDIRVTFNGELYSVATSGSKGDDYNWEDELKRAKKWLDDKPASKAVIWETNRDWCRWQFFEQNPKYTADKEQVRLYQEQMKGIE